MVKDKTIKNLKDMDEICEKQYSCALCNAQDKCSKYLGVMTPRDLLTFFKRISEFENESF